MLDDRFCCPSTYQCFAPGHFLLTERFFTRGLNWLMPAKRPMDEVALGWDRPQEDEFALVNLGAPSPYRRIAFPATSGDRPRALDVSRLPPAELERWRAALRRFLALLAVRDPRRPVLKSPPHTARVGELARMFPGARFLHVVRDPFVVLPSTLRLWRALHGVQALQRARDEDIERYAFAAFEEVDAAFERDRAGLAPGRLHELRYEDLVADPVPRLREAYERLDLGDFERVRPALERQVGSIDLKRLLWDRPWSPHRQPEAVVQACRNIRRHLGAMLDARLATPGLDDIAGAVLEARDTDTGAPFTREELIDQLGVFFLAGHETTASSLTWAFFILSQRPDVVARLRAEVAQVVGDGPVRLEHTKRLPTVRNVFREVLRLYPPITFLPRVAARDTAIGDRRVPRGTMLMIAPWSIHRHERLWPAPDRFDPDRFLPEREAAQAPGSYLPFGAGPRVCVGAAFATIETALILARLVRRFDFAASDPAAVRPYARLTTRPAAEIRMTVRNATAGPG